jgi:hypothetical protein
VDTPQPTNLSTAEWCDRVAVINVGLIYLKKGAKTMRLKKMSSTNMSRLKNHDHAWSKCPNKPISKNFSGKSYTENPASMRTVSQRRPKGLGSFFHIAENKLAKKLIITLTVNGFH